MNRSGKLSASEHKRLQAEVIKRDKGRCVICLGSPVQVHELEHRSKYRPLSDKTFRLDNMVCLCPHCHDTWHFGPHLKEFREMARRVIQRHLDSLKSCS